MPTIMLPHLSKWREGAQGLRPARVPHALQAFQDDFWSCKCWNVGLSQHKLPCWLGSGSSSSPSHTATCCNEVFFRLPVHTFCLWVVNQRPVQPTFPLFPWHSSSVLPSQVLPSTVLPCENRDLQLLWVLLNDFCGHFLSHNALVWYKVFLKAVTIFASLFGKDWVYVLQMNVALISFSLIGISIGICEDLLQCISLCKIPCSKLFLIRVAWKMPFSLMETGDVSSKIKVPGGWHTMTAERAVM